MAHIIFADKTGRYDGRDLELRPLGGTESSVIRCARELVRRGHRVDVYSNCSGKVVDQGVTWLPLSGARPDSCDLFIACHQPELLGFVRRPRRRANWVLWPVSQLRHYKKFWRSWWYPNVPVLTSQYQARTYSWVLPPHDPHFVLPNGLPDDVRGFAPLESAPGPHAIFASNPERKLHELVDIWISSILPRVPGAVLDVYGLNNLSPGDDAWQLWEGRLLPTGVPAHIQASVRVHPTPDRAGLIEAMRKARVLLYLGHKAEAFCISVAEAQALGVPAVLAPVTVLPERVIDGVTGFVAEPDSAFANAAIRLLTDDVLWRQQHEAALKHQQGIDWAEHAARLEAALLGDIGTLGN